MTNINHYFEGQVIKLSATFTASGIPTDPTTITLKIKKPDKTTATYTDALGQITKDGDGLYSKKATLDQPGLWFYRWIGTGAVEAVGEKKFDVKASEID